MLLILIPFHLKNDTDGQAEGAEGAEEAEEAEEVISISNFVNWYKVLSKHLATMQMLSVGHRQKP